MQVESLAFNTSRGVYTQIICDINNTQLAYYFVDIFPLVLFWDKPKYYFI